MSWQEGLALGCLVLIAVEPAERLWRRFENWYERKQIHKRSL
jgi:hypothetical protein